MFTLRVARPTGRLVELIHFYCDRLGLQVLGLFMDYAEFDGIMVGHLHAPYHLEFTHHRG